MTAEMDSTRPSSFTTTLNYYLPPEQGGKDEYVLGSGNDGKSNPYLPGEVVMHDVRMTGDVFDLDKHGFQFVKHHTRYDEKYEWTDKGMLKDHYMKEVEHLLKEHTSATTVIPAKAVARGLDPGSDGKYAAMVHVDMSYDGAHVLGPLWAGDHAAKLRTCRWAIVSVWRPVVHEATRNPLAVCDARSVSEQELREVIAISPKNEWEKPTGMWRIAKPDTPQQHRWFYKSSMDPDDLLIIKLFDTAGDVARRTPHTAFTTPWDHGETRKSVEVRAICFFEHEPVDGEEPEASSR